MTRSHTKYHRAYIDGRDLSGYAVVLPQMAWVFDAEPEAALTDGSKNIIPGQASIDVGALNCILDNDADGAFANYSTNTGEVNVAFAIGTTAAPAAGDPAFCWKVKQTGYNSEGGSGFVMANIPFGGSSSEGVLTYDKPWGSILHPKGAETAVNSSTGIDDLGSSSTAGGIFVYHLFTSNGTVTLKAQDAATNTDVSFSDITGATSGSIDASSNPASGLVALSTSLSVERYLRWQLTLGTATTATFFSAFIRGN